MFSKLPSMMTMYKMEDFLSGDDSLTFLTSAFMSFLTLQKILSIPENSALLSSSPQLSGSCVRSVYSSCARKKKMNGTQFLLSVNAAVWHSDSERGLNLILDLPYTMASREKAKRYTISANNISSSVKWRP